MYFPLHRIVWSVVALFAMTLANAHLAAQETKLPAKVEGCPIDLSMPGKLRDVLSNALALGFGLAGDDVRLFLDAERARGADAEGMRKAAAKRFGLAAEAVDAMVDRYRHCNCKHPLLPGQVPLPEPIPDAPEPAAEGGDDAGVVVTPFARDVLLHVVLHEIGHALVREFDLPVLANEETMADAFATHYLVQHLPDRAEAVLRARVASLMVEAREVPRADWPVNGEHDNDARRAFSIAALAVAANRTKYAAVAELAGMTGKDVSKAVDYGAEIHRAWRRTLTPLWMPEGQPSNEARVVVPEGNAMFAQLTEHGIVRELESVLQRFDWHSTVAVRFEAGDGTANWSRSGRAITVKSGYVRRFIAQGPRAGF